MPAGSVVALPVGRTTYESLEAVAETLRRPRSDQRAFLVSDPWHNARIRADGRRPRHRRHPSATWTSAARTEETRFPGYVRETFAYLYYRLGR